jgi:hypothetical protein
MAMILGLGGNVERMFPGRYEIDSPSIFPNTVCSPKVLNFEFPTEQIPGV